MSHEESIKHLEHELHIARHMLSLTHLRERAKRAFYTARIHALNLAIERHRHAH